MIKVRLVYWNMPIREYLFLEVILKVVLKFILLYSSLTDMFYICVNTSACTHVQAF